MDSSSKVSLLRWEQISHHCARGLINGPAPTRPSAPAEARGRQTDRRRASFMYDRPGHSFFFPRFGRNWVGAERISHITQERSDGKHWVQ